MKKPSYPLSLIRKMVETGKVRINPKPALEDAMYYFGWGKEEIKKCLLKLKPSDFHKTETHSKFPPTMMDYYKAVKIMEDNNVYTHFYIHPKTGFLTISSFKEI